MRKWFYIAYSTVTIARNTHVYQNEETHISWKRKLLRIPWDKEHNGCRGYVNVEKKIRQTFNFATVSTDRGRINNRVVD